MNKKVFTILLITFLALILFAQQGNLGKSEEITKLQAAAKSGDALAQFQLGVMYYNGEELIANVKEAVKWFKLAAEQGNSNAQENLGLCYYEGSGVEVDVKESYYWLALAADLCTDVNKEEYTKEKERIMAELTPEQVEEVNLRIAAWLEKFKQG